jgi:beta-lactamase class A
MVQPDTEYTVQELMRSMIVKSDNLATQTILQHIPSEYVSDVFSHIGVPLEETGADVALSVKEYASFFRVLYNASFLTREYSEQALALLAETDFSYGIEAGLPSDIEVAHKWGVRTSTAQGEEAEQLHDCGIVYYPNHPYLLCVMTRGDDTLRQAQLIAEVSRVVHDEVTKSFSMPE